MHTELLTTDNADRIAEAQARAVALLEAGAAVALPTETVYGLAADTLRPDALVKIFEAKERPYFDPLICHLPDIDWLERMTRIPEESRALVDELAARFWPGPLTLVLPRSEIVPDLVTSGLETVALRMSAHPVFRGIVQRFGRPLSAPSANRFGRISPTAAAHVMSELDGRIPLIVDGGPTAHGVESTIVAVEGTTLRLLRAGPVTPEELCAAWQHVRRLRGEPDDASTFYAALSISRQAETHVRSLAMEAPGLMKSHYAPRTPLRLLAHGANLVEAVASSGVEPIRVGVLAFRTVSRDAGFAAKEILSPSGDLREAAATLFAKLRHLDEANLDLIIAESVPEEGLGIAIMDRLRKAQGAGDA